METQDGHVHYAVARDGVSIAFTVNGEGRPLLLMLPFGSTALDPARLTTVEQALYGRLAEHRMVIRYDVRGSGLSDRDVTDMSLPTMLDDIDAVLDRAGVEQADVVGVASSGLVALAYVLERPERVGRLILWCAVSSGRELLSPARQAMDVLAEQDWRTYSEAAASLAFGWEQPDDARRYAATLRESATQELRAAWLEMLGAIDLRDRLEHVQQPALVVHVRDYALFPLSSGRRLAACLPDAELVLFDGASIFPAPREVPRVLETVDRFLGGPGGFESEADPEPASTSYGLRTILFTDVEGSTALTDRLGDVAARDVMRAHEAIIRRALALHGGDEVKSLGDGFLLSFPSAARALECAITIQRAVAEYGSTSQEPLRVRIGVNAGEPIAEGDDLFGTVVNLAARIAAHASGAEVLVADVVRQLVAGKGFLFSERGHVALRGFEDAVRLWELGWRESGDEAPVLAGARSELDSDDPWRSGYFAA